MKVVSNASVLIGLSSIDRLELLYERFPAGILIPPTVWTEVVEQGQGRPGARQTLDDLQTIGKFRLSQTLCQTALQEVGE